MAKTAKKNTGGGNGNATIALNRKARHEYFIE
ncbi:MAG: SsrA-binding protein, partial [Chromatiaceae bacterium]|nr:SsrA-binding protein [Chromatiaceae bacterium]